MNKTLTQNIATHFSHNAQFDAVNDGSVNCLIMPVYQGESLTGVSDQVDQTSQGHLQKVIDASGFEGKPGQVQVIYHVAGIKSEAIMLVGCGKKDDYSLTTVIEAGKKVSSTLKQNKLKSAACFLDVSADTAIQQLIMAVTNELYTFDHYRSNKDNDDKASDYQLETFVIAAETSQDEIDAGVSRASGRDVARELANHPGNVCTPTYLANHAVQLADNCDQVQSTVLEEAEMEKLGMGALLSVGHGSDEPSKLIVLEYNGGKDGEAPVVLVGKGISFDTGGISLKPGANMDEMKFDMGGAASAMGAMHAICAMELPLNVVMIIASAENMPSGRATKPGDIVTSMSGKTIEVLNTDAEGRLVLCDALTYAERFNPKAVVDMATLTGACIIALGHHISGLVSNNDNLANQLLEAGVTAEDEAWRLPMNEKYAKQLKSAFADLGNIGGRAAGTITAACFLSKFAENYPWAHLDIAGTAWEGKKATGRPVALLTQFLMNQAKG